MEGYKKYVTMHRIFYAAFLLYLVIISVGNIDFGFEREGIPYHILVPLAVYFVVAIGIEILIRKKIRMKKEVEKKDDIEKFSGLWGI